MEAVSALLDALFGGGRGARGGLGGAGVRGPHSLSSALGGGLSASRARSARGGDRSDAGADAGTGACGGGDGGAGTSAATRASSVVGTSSDLPTPHLPPSASLSSSSRRVVSPSIPLALPAIGSKGAASSVDLPAFAAHPPLPARGGKCLASAAAHSSDYAPPVPSWWGGRTAPRVLVVDDERSNRRLLRRMLARCGVRDADIDEADDGSTVRGGHGGAVRGRERSSSAPAHPSTHPPTALPLPRA